jgi:hypothetical protein
VNTEYYVAYGGFISLCEYTRNRMLNPTIKITWVILVDYLYIFIRLIKTEIVHYLLNLILFSTKCLAHNLHDTISGLLHKV